MISPNWQHAAVNFHFKLWGLPTNEQIKMGRTVTNVMGRTVTNVDRTCGPTLLLVFSGNKICLNYK